MPYTLQGPWSAGDPINITEMSAIDQGVKDLDDALNSLSQDHGDLTGNDDDDHTQYLNTSRHNALDHSTALSSAVASDLSDVVVSSVASGEVLARSGSNWINRTLSEAGIAASSHNHAASNITSGTFSMSRLPTTTQYASLTSSNLASGSLTKVLYDQSVQLGGTQTITGVKTFTTQPQFNAGLDIPGSGTLDMHWPGVRRINDSAWGSLRLEGDNGYRMYFHTSTKYVKDDITPITAERSREAIRLLEPVTYLSNGKENIGFVAENVQKAEPLTAPAPRATERGPDEVPTYSEDGIIAHLVNVVTYLLDRDEER